MIFKKGRPGFKEAVSSFLDSYVYSDYPGLTGYGYQAEMIEESEGVRIMEKLARKIEEINPDGVYGHPEFRVRGETKWRSVADMNDFPVPTAEPWDYEEELDEDEPMPKARHPRMLFNRRRR